MNPARALTAPFRVSRRGTVLLTVAAVLAVGVVTPSEAQADPSLADAEKAVAALNHSMEVTTEQYNDAREDMKASKAKVDALEPRARQLRAQLGGYENKLAEFAASAYYGGRASAYSALLESGSPQTFLDQVAFLQYLSGAQRADLDVLLDTKRKFDATKSKVDAELAKQVTHEKTLREKRSAIVKDLVKWRQLQTRLGGGSGSNVEISTYNGPATGKAAVALQFAYAQQGKMYEWGAAGPMRYDCSGFTMRSWAEAGVYMPHSARQQYAMFPKVPLSDVRPGDLLFYGSPIHHVAMAIGGGKVIHASQQGEPIRIVSIARGGGRLVGAVRPS